MIITEKMIRELQKRVDLSYEDAEKALRRAGGNIDMAEIHARKKTNSFLNRLFREFEKIINATLIYRIRVYKHDDQFINIPILSLILILIIIGVNKTLLLGVVFVVLALLADCNLQIDKVNGREEFRFYKTVNKDEVTTPKHSQEEQVTKETSDADVNLGLDEEVNDKDEDDYYEVTIDK